MGFTRFSDLAKRGLPALTVAVGGTLALRRLDDHDTWWQLASGRWIVRHHAIPRTDTPSFTVPDHPWTNLQWLYDVILYGLHRLGGVDLLVIASAVACTAAGTLATRLPGIPAGWRRATLPEPRVLRRLLLTFALSTLVILVNPYFTRGALFPLKLLSRIDASHSAFQAIGEFHRPFSGIFPTFCIRSYQVLFFVGLFVVAAAALLQPRPPMEGAPSGETDAPGFHMGWAASFGSFTFLSLLARRNLGLFAFGAVPMLAPFLRSTTRRLPGGLRSALRRASTRAAPLLAVAYVALIALVATNGYYHWDGTVREFGLGVFKANFPIRACAFARQAGLRPRLYNDLAAGGYLTWDPPVEGGVYIDGRLEVYDTAFFARYLSDLAHPRAWRRQADAYGINTVLLFHRWSNRRPLIRSLGLDPAWSLVYMDEAAVIFVRTAGNEERIREARRRYTEWHRRIDRELTAPVSPWQWPVERVKALESYADLLGFVGDADGAARYYEQMLRYSLPARKEQKARIFLGFYLANRGKREKALRHFERALELDPTNRRLRQQIERLNP